MNKSFDFILTIDIGNTLSKCALFSADKSIITKFNLEKLPKIISSYNLSNLNTLSIKSSVKEKNEQIPLKCIDVNDLFKGKKFLNMPVHYNETVGIDRLVAAYLCFSQSSRSFLIIDTGTFTTIDSVDIKGFNGGYILPGLNTIEKSYENGSLLKVPSSINTKLSFNFPDTTLKAIQQGAILSYLAPIKEVVIQSNPSNVLITGGNGELLYNFLYSQKSSLFRLDASIQLDLNLIHNALLEIAQRCN
jgi:type III pantothenate kinase